MARTRAPRAAPDAWPAGHLGFVFHGVGEFEAAATRYLADGAAHNERVMFVADDPDPARWPQHLVERGALLVASTTEIYGLKRVVDPMTQRELFVAAIAEALAAGYAGLRVAADNTSLIGHPEAVRAWAEWEQIGDELIESAPISAMCCFDRDRASGEAIDAVIGVHPIRL